MLAVRLKNLLRELDDVLAAVVLLGQLDLAPERLLIAHPHAVRQVLDLGASVVVVVLALHLPTRLRQHARDAVAQRGISSGADVDRTGRIGADELHLHAPLPAERHRSELGAFGQNRVDLLAEPVVGEGEVEEARRSYLDARQIRRRILGDHGRDRPGDLDRIRPARPDRAFGPQREARREVALLGLGRTLDRHLG